MVLHADMDFDHNGFLVASTFASLSGMTPMYENGGINTLAATIASLTDVKTCVTTLKVSSVHIAVNGMGDGLAMETSTYTMQHVAWGVTWEHPFQPVYKRLQICSKPLLTGSATGGTCT